MPKEETQFKPGESGNPNGRPRTENSWRYLLEQVGQEEHKAENEKLTKKQLIAKVLYQNALKGNLKAIEMIMNRMEGQPKQSVENNDTVTVKFDDPAEKEV